DCGEASRTAAGAAPGVHRSVAGTLRIAGRRDLLRCERPGPGRLQQIYSVFTASGGRVFSERERVAGAGEGVPGDESVEPGDGGSEFGVAGGTVRRRRTPAGVRDFL